MIVAAVQAGLKFVAHRIQPHFIFVVLILAILMLAIVFIQIVDVLDAAEQRIRLAAEYKAIGLHQP
jgi:ABC-type phosphate transport system permease subunit